MNVASVMVKMAKLPDIFAAAQLLHNLKLLEATPAEIVKKYVAANPEINEALALQSNYPECRVAESSALDTQK